MADDKNKVSDEQFAAAVFEDGGGLVIQLDGIAEAKFENVPKGIYNAEVDDVQFSMSKSSGAPMFTLKSKIVGGEYDGRALYSFISFSQKALPYSKATLLRLAPTIFDKPFKPQELIDQGTLLGIPHRIRVGQEEYEGEMRSKVSQILAAAPNGAGGAQAGGTFG